jgi:hypothetical protein
MSYDDDRAALQVRHPYWAIWYVPMATGGVTWCAQLRSNIQTHTTSDLDTGIDQAEKELATRLSGHLGTSGDTPA